MRSPILAIGIGHYFLMRITGVVVSILPEKLMVFIPILGLMIDVLFQQNDSNRSDWLKVEATQLDILQNLQNFCDMLRS